MNRPLRIGLVLVVTLVLVLGLAVMVSASPNEVDGKLRLYPSFDGADSWIMSAPFSATVQSTVTVTKEDGESQVIQLQWLSYPCNCPHLQFAQFGVSNLIAVGPMSGDIELVPPDGWSVEGRTFRKNVLMPTIELIQGGNNLYGLIVSENAPKPEDIELWNLWGGKCIVHLTWKGRVATFNFDNLGAIGPVEEFLVLKANTPWKASGRYFVHEDFHMAKIFLPSLLR
jgi:hypothetical protein